MDRMGACEMKKKYKFKIGDRVFVYNMKNHFAIIQSINIFDLDHPYLLKFEGYRQLYGYAEKHITLFNNVKIKEKLGIC